MLARIWKKRNCHSLLVGIQNVMATLEDRLAVFNKINIPNHTNSVIMLFGIYMNKLKTYVQTKICIWIFISTFVHNHQKFEGHKCCPLVDEWMNSNAPITWKIIQSPQNYILRKDMQEP